MSGGWLVEIVVLAMIAGFVALRLVSVLGRRTGHEQPLPQTLDRSASDGMSRQPGGAETQGPASIVPDSNIDGTEEHMSELQSLMRNSYAVLGLKKNKPQEQHKE